MKCKHSWRWLSEDSIANQYFYCIKCLAEAKVSEINRTYTITEAEEEK